MHSATDPAGPQAALIAHLWWLLFWVSSVVFVVVVGFMLFAVVRAVRRAEPAGPEATAAMRIGVTGAVAVTVVTLFALLVASFWTGRALSAPGSPNALTIEVIGHQWWWEVQYPDAVPARTVVTANEIHVPVGRPVVLRTTSRDVIHSFWAPSLQGKKDLIPGHVTTTGVRVDRPGVYRGQCAEFCGYQHAKMAFVVVAEPEPEFARWLEAARQPAVDPSDPLAQRGRGVFLDSACVLCHTIAGTPAAGKMGPDLTHLASRLTLAAGTLPNTRGALGGWILDPQRVKPGTNMPPTALRPDDVEPLLAYLEALR